MSVNTPSPFWDPLAPLGQIADRYLSRWWVPLVAGIAWLVIGFVVLRFDDATVDVIAILFGVLLILAAVAEAARAMISPGAWKFWHWLVVALLIVGAVISFVDPGGTFTSLAIVVGIYFLVVGIFDVVSSLFSTHIPGWWVQLLMGIAQVLLGWFASSSYAASVVVLVTLVSAAAIVRGVSEIAAAFTIRSLGRHRAAHG